MGTAGPDSKAQKTILAFWALSGGQTGMQCPALPHSTMKGIQDNLLQQSVPPGAPAEASGASNAEDCSHICMSQCVVQAQSAAVGGFRARNNCLEAIFLETELAIATARKAANDAQRQLQVSPTPHSWGSFAPLPPPPPVTPSTSPP